MKTLETTCQVCRRSIRIEVEEPPMFSEDVILSMATCDDCFDEERVRIRKLGNDSAKMRYEPSTKREYRNPHND